MEDAISKAEQAVRSLIYASDHNSGYEPSLSAYHKAVDEANEAIEALKAGQQSKVPDSAALTILANTNLLAYVLQDEIHNRLTPRVVDIAYTAFMVGKEPNSEDGGPSDWFTDTKPVVMKAIDRLRSDLLFARPEQARQDGASLNNKFESWWKSVSNEAYTSEEYHAAKCAWQACAAQSINEEITAAKEASCETK